jgi:folate-binding Fe-S cluster repair protein YgfZ
MGNELEGGGFPMVKEEEYEKMCRLNGISSSAVMTNKFPFMFNSDFFNGFSFNKGCYLGQ